jgi:hypothetical protein
MMEHRGPGCCAIDLHNSAAACHVQTTLFHGDACEALGEDAALELVDWAARRLLWLNSRVGRAKATATGRWSRRSDNTSPCQRSSTGLNPLPSTGADFWHMYPG